MSVARIKSRIDQLEAAAGSKHGAVRVILVRPDEDSGEAISARQSDANGHVIVVKFVSAEGIKRDALAAPGSIEPLPYSADAVSNSGRGELQSSNGHRFRPFR
jgi:hypothetical protein